MKEKQIKKTTYFQSRDTVADDNFTSNVHFSYFRNRSNDEYDSEMKVTKFDISFDSDMNKFSENAVQFQDVQYSSIKSRQPYSLVENQDLWSTVCEDKVRP